MILELPLSSDPVQSFTCQLDDIKLYFEVKFNSRAGIWTIDIYDDATRDAILLGAPIVLGQDLFDPYNLPYGALVAQDKTGQGKDATADDLGSRVALYWVSADEDFA